MTNTTISVDVMLSLVQKLRQEKAECEKSISRTTEGMGVGVEGGRNDQTGRGCFHC